VAAGYAVFDRRDFGAGVLATRPGPARAGRGLETGLGLAWRLQRPAFVAWLAGLVISGLSFGVLGDDVGDLVGDSDVSKEMMLQGSSDIVNAFYATMIVMLSLLACGFAISSALRPQGEEGAGRVESLLATALPRTRWLAGHVVITVLGTVAMLLGAGLGLGLSYALVTGDGSAVTRKTGGMVSYLPAVLVLSACTRLLYGLVPRAAKAAWLLLLVAAVVLLFGEVLKLPQWFQDVSPFEHLAFVPAESFAWAPFVVLSVAQRASPWTCSSSLCLCRRSVSRCSGRSGLSPTAPRPGSAAAGSVPCSRCWPRPVGER
jgi:ABC-2 type transport system permease protein